MAADHPIKRCAVYTRKSSEEGLEQEFNSLQAQRESCEAYIASQKHEGWKLVTRAYDDGGISGGTMQRPGLQQLLSDIQAGQVDVIVVYKVDRLTRSLADFAKMVEVFDAHGVSFVAVTQQFNTTTSMGRLTLNVLLSFAQFEREVTGERIRDKIAASKKKGMWMGGVVPLGYRVHERKLLVVPEDAETVRMIFREYLDCSGIRELASRLRIRGMKGLRPSSQDGISRGALFVFLRNPIYIGRIHHKGETFPGEHEAIVEASLWEAVQAKLKDRGHGVPYRTRKTESSPLIGKLFDEFGRGLTPSHANKQGQRYRYYVTHTDDVDADRESELSRQPWSLPAADIEHRVGEVIRSMAVDRVTMADVALKAGWSTADLEGLITRVAQIKDRTVLDCVERVNLSPCRLTVKVAWPGNPKLVMERWVPVVLKRRGRERRLVIQNDSASTYKADRFVVQALSRGMRFWERMKADPSASAQHFAREEGIDQRMIGKALPLAFLAPDLVGALASGRHPEGMTARKLLNLDSMPLGWDEQRRWLGMA